MRKNIVLILSLLVVSLMLTNCAKRPTHLLLTVKAGANINPDVENISSPLMLKLYDLKSAEKFSKLDFWTLNDASNAKLESELSGKSKHIILANQEQQYKIIFDDNSKFIGVIASFRDIEHNSTWRFIKNLDRNTFNSIDLEIDKFQIKEIE